MLVADCPREASRCFSRREWVEQVDACQSGDAGPRRGRLQHDGPHHPQSSQATRLHGRRRRVRRRIGARQDARQELRAGDLRLEHGADDRLRVAQAGPRGPDTRAGAVHHDHRRVQDRERDRCEEGGREQLHRQAVQRADAATQNPVGVCRRCAGHVRCQCPRLIARLRGATSPG